MIEVMNEVKLEVEGQEKPAVVGESLGRLVFSDQPRHTVFVVPLGSLN
ncbi:MAG: hypothetical protein GY724_05255 [Actinomycetia bacterium]|nr:hypothetical protein [Actinomycetes bacterium]MCP4226220.1 hypothetical protein [Actinomycetes bacterium]MCP5032620.1 hypothetical protein [Actinomycetes bacterium]